jgi:hypothetical protein
VISSKRRIGEDYEILDRYFISRVENNAERILQTKHSYYGVSTQGSGWKRCVRPRLGLGWCFMLKSI